MIENLDIKITDIDNIEKYNQINSILSTLTYSGIDGGEYPALIKGLENIWEVNGTSQSSYDPFQIINDLLNFGDIIVSLISKEPDQENLEVQTETEKKDETQTGGINDEGVSLDQVLSDTGMYNALNSIDFASVKINPQEISNIAQQTTLKLRNSWNIDKFTGYLSAFNHKCPICGKEVKYIPLNGYCSLECFLKDVDAQIKGIERSVNSQLKRWTKQNMNAVTSYVKTTLTYINELPLLLAESETQLTAEMLNYVRVRLNYFSIKLKILTNRILIWKNDLIISWLVEYQLGVLDKEGLEYDKEKSKEETVEDDEGVGGGEETKPNDYSGPDETSSDEGESQENPSQSVSNSNSDEPEDEEDDDNRTWTDKMNEKVDKISDNVFTAVFEKELNIEEILKNLDVVTNVLSTVTRNLQFITKITEEFEGAYPMLKKLLNISITHLIPSDSFGFVATNRARMKNPIWPNYIDISYPCSVKYSAPQKNNFYKSIEKKALSRPKLKKIKDIVDKVVNYSFPPIQEFEYLMSPQLFTVRLVMSDQNVTAIAKNVKDLLLLCQGEPDLLPKYENMTVKNRWWITGLMKSIVPTVQFTFGKVVPPVIKDDSLSDVQ